MKTNESPTAHEMELAEPMLLELIYKRSSLKGGTSKTHPITACMMQGDERICQNVEFRNINQLRTFWCGWYYGSGNTIPVNAVIREVTQEEFPPQHYYNDLPGIDGYYPD